MADPLSFDERTSIVESILRKNGLVLPETFHQALSGYAAMLREWNGKVNLISRKDEENLFEAHILHSLSIPILFDIPVGRRVLDIGTGGGLPGIPLAILRPDLHVVLLDSIKKKTMVLEDIVSRLPVGNVSILTGRAEELGKKLAAADKVDIVVARAVAPATDLLKWTKGWIKKGDRGVVRTRSVDQPQEFRTPLLIMLKGGDLTEELQQVAVKLPLVGIREVPLLFPGSYAMGLQGKRVLVAVL